VGGTKRDVNLAQEIKDICSYERCVFKNNCNIGTAVGINPAYLDTYSVFASVKELCSFYCIAVK
jgi:hypothetical protein